MLERYCLVSDGDGHWFVIPVYEREAWDTFCDSPNYGYEPVPEFAETVGGAPSLVTFIH